MVQCIPLACPTRLQEARGDGPSATTMPGRGPGRRGHSDSWRTSGDHAAAAARGRRRLAWSPGVIARKAGNDASGYSGCSTWPRASSPATRPGSASRLLEHCSARGKGTTREEDNRDQEGICGVCVRIVTSLFARDVLRDYRSALG